MYKPVSLFIGLRYMMSVRKQGVLSFYAWISILGLTLGVATLITVLSVLNGFEQVFEQRIIGLTAPIKVFSFDQNKDGKILEQQLKQYPKSKTVTPFSELPALAVTANHTESLLLWAMDAQREIASKQWSNYISTVQWHQLEKQPEGIFLGEHLAKKLRLQPGQTLHLLIAKSGSNAREQSLLPDNKTVILLGTFNTKTDLDKHIGIMNLTQANAWLQRAGPQGFKVSIDQVMLAPFIATELFHYLHQNYSVIDWTYSYDNLYQAIKMPRTVMGLLLLLILLVAALNLTTSLVMTVKQKNKQMAILKTYGFCASQMIGIFLVQGAVIGLLGISAGIFLGCILSEYLPDLIHQFEQITHRTLFEGDSYFVSFLPSVLQMGDVLKVAITAFLLCLLAAIYPAWRAASMQPVEILRQVP